MDHFYYELMLVVVAMLVLLSYFDSSFHQKESLIQKPFLGFASVGMWRPLKKYFLHFTMFYFGYN